MARHYSSKKNKSSMIHDDMSAPCNLPTHVIDKYWAPREYALSQSNSPADLYNGVEKQLSEDKMDLKREFAASKY